ncbi:hypothetical protein BH09MYX1_BH09MYX1_37530 [soil metagenome]
MFEHKYTLLCARLLVDAQTRSVSVIDLIDMARVSSTLPRDREVVLPLDFVIITCWRRTGDAPPTVLPIRFTVTGPDGSDGQTDLGEYVITLDPNHLGWTHAEMSGLPVRGAGQYEVRSEARLANGEWVLGGTAGLWIEEPKQVDQLMRSASTILLASGLFERAAVGAMLRAYTGREAGEVAGFVAQMRIETDEVHSQVLREVDGEILWTAPKQRTGTDGVDAAAHALVDWFKSASGA